MTAFPAIPDDLSWLAGELGPDERLAMREIAERGDLIFVDGEAYLVAPVSPRCVDALSAFEAEGEDREPEPLESDDDDCGAADEPSFPLYRPMLPIGKRRRQS